MKDIKNILSLITSIFAIISSSIGIFYSNGGKSFFVKNIYGEQIELYGDGIYAYNSILKVGATKGTDIVVLAISIMVILLIIFENRIKWAKIVKAGLVCILLYASICLIMGVSFNRLFPIYLIYFSSTLFSTIFNIIDVIKSECFKEEIYLKHLKGSSIFLIIGGCSVLVWLMFIIPTVFSGTPMEIIEIYTTEPTFVLDLGIIFPTAVTVGILLWKKNKTAYKLASILFTALTCVGLCVIFQTIVQIYLGIILPIGQLLGLVISFIILGGIALILNIKLLKYII